MRKVYLIMAVTIIAAMVCTTCVSAREYKIGYVDLARVLDEYQRTKDLGQSFDTKGKAKEAERKKMVDEIRKLQDEQALLSEKGREEKQGVIDEKKKGLMEYDRKAAAELGKMRNDMIDELLKDIETVITDYAKETNYDYIQNMRMLLYGKEEFDLTNDIILRLNKMTAAPAAQGAKR